MKKIPLHKKLLLGAVTGGLGYGSYKLFKHTDAGSRKMEMISPVTPLLLVADDERRNAAIAGGVGAAAGAAGASRLFKAPYAKSADETAGNVAKHINSLKDDLSKTPWYKLGKKRAIKSEIADVFEAGKNSVARSISRGRKAGVAGALVGGVVGGVAGAGLYAGRHDIKNKINNLYNKTISKENRPNLVNSAENDDYIRTGAVTGGILGAVGRKGFAVAPVLGGAALDAGLGYVAKKNSNDNYNSPIKDHIKAIAKTTIPLGAAGGAAAVHIGSKAIDKAMKEKPHLVSQLPAHVLENVKQLKGAKGALIGAGVGAAGAGVGAAGAALSSPVFGSIYGGAVHLKRAITEKNNIKSSEAQESLRRVNEIIAGLTVKQATPIFKKIVAKKKALGASTSQAQKAALKILHRIDK